MWVNDEKWMRTVKKIHRTRNKTFLPIFKETHEMFKSWMSVIQIAKYYNKNRETIYHRLRKYGDFKQRGVGKKKTINADF